MSDLSPNKTSRILLGLTLAGSLFLWIWFLVGLILLAPVLWKLWTPKGADFAHGTVVHGGAWYSSFPSFLPLLSLLLFFFFQRQALAGALGKWTVRVTISFYVAALLFVGIFFLGVKPRLFPPSEESAMEVQP